MGMACGFFESMHQITPYHFLQIAVHRAHWRTREHALVISLEYIEEHRAHWRTREHVLVVCYNLSMLRVGCQ